MAQVQAAYDYWNAVRVRASSTGVAMMPLSGPPPMPSVPVILDGGSDMDAVVFAAGRWNAPPIIPAPILRDRNRILLGGSQSAAFPIPFTTDTKLYEITGHYIWGILNPEGLLSPMPLGSPPLNGKEGPLTFNEYLQMAGIMRTDLITQPNDDAMATGDNSPFLQLNWLLRQINEKW